MNKKDPIQTLYTLGECDIGFENWPDYPSMGLLKEHAPELIKLATDMDLLLVRIDMGSPKIWTPIHAWRALGQLKIEDAIEPLISIMDPMAELLEEWADDELPHVFRLIGPSSAPPLIEFLDDESHEMYARATAIEALGEIMGFHGDVREECIGVLVRYLKNFRENDPHINARICWQLASNYVVDYIPEMMAAYEADCVDRDWSGEWEDLVYEFDLLEICQETEILEDAGGFDDLSSIPEWDRDHGSEAFRKKWEEWEKRDWISWFMENLTFPFTVERMEDDDDAYFTDVTQTKPFRLGHKMEAVEILDYEDRFGIYIGVKEAGKKGSVPLADCEVVLESDKNYWPVREYGVWYSNL